MCYRLSSPMTSAKMVLLVILCVYFGHAFAQVITINHGVCGHIDEDGKDYSDYENRRQANSCTPKRPKNCQDVYDFGSKETGNYMIYPDGTGGFQVRCDMNDKTGAWTVFQRRISDSDFYKTWDEYKYGFGNLSENFWLGNRQLHILTSQGWNELRVDMEFPNSTRVFAAYKSFKVADDDEGFKLTVGEYHGNAGDSLAYANGYKFSTHDRDNDIDSAKSCAQLFHGAWWYTKCHSSNLNGDFGSTEYAKGLNWRTATGYYQSMAKTEMKVRHFIKRT